MILWQSKCFNKAIKLNPSDLTNFNNKGKALTELWKFEEAVLFYSKLIESNLEYSDAHNNKGWALFQLNKHNDK